MTAPVRTLIDTLRLGTPAPPDLPMRWKRLRPDSLPELVAHEGAGIWLYRRLRVLELFDALPPPFRERLKGLAFAAAATRLRVEEEAVTVLRMLDAAGIPVVLIKGMARSALASRFPFLDARPTCDVDLLLPGAAIDQGYALLQSRGYVRVPSPALRQEHHHLPGLWSGKRVAVELHSSTSSRLPPDIAWARATTGGEALDWAGIRVKVPPAAEMIWSAAVHAISDEVVRGFRLQHFLEVAALLAGGVSLDWSLVFERAARGEVHDANGDAEYPVHLVLLWLDGAVQLAGVDSAPGAGPRASLDLEALLAWRLAVIGRRRRLGRALTDRMLEEGPRALLDLPRQPSPGGTGPLARVRRGTASLGSRLLFETWRAARAG
ncbi:MAG TPA: nucleotidyltransferase family protein [Gemmatimonadales bacterium]